jgi:hypothetical protein
MSAPPQIPQCNGKKYGQQREDRHARIHGAVAGLIEQVEGFHHAFITDG